MPAAISYIRFSASHQGKGSTTERQQQMIDKWFSDHPEYTLSPLSAKDLGKSGYKGEHLKSGLGTIIAAIEAGQIRSGDVLLIESMDRLGRLPSSEMHPLIWSIVKAGVSIVTLEDSMTYTEESLNKDQSQLFILTGKVHSAYDYSARLSRRITNAYEKKRRLAREGQQIKAPRPYWIDSNGKLIPEAAEEMRHCIDLYLQGYGYRQIIIELDLSESHYNTLKRRFQSRALIGEWANKVEGQPIHGVFEPLIDSNTFYRLQAEMKRRSLNPVPAGEYEISGLVKCGCCNSSYHFRRREYKDYVIHYANCSRYLKKASCSNGKTWPYEALLCIMQETKEYWLFEEAISFAANEAGSEIDPLKSELAEVEEARRGIFKLVEIDPENQQALDRYKDLSEQVKALKDKIKRAEAETTNLSLDSHKVWDAFEEIKDNPTLLRETLKKTGYQITVVGDIATATNRSTHRYRLVRRSQKYGCYILAALPSENDIEILGLPEDSASLYIALNRSHYIIEQSEADLLARLEKGQLQDQWDYSLTGSETRLSQHF